eukprot:1662620-Karenia_brevis.AAC.1
MDECVIWVKVVHLCNLLVKVCWQGQELVCVGAVAAVVVVGVVVVVVVAVRVQLGPRVVGVVL